jgi:archaellum biogenesis ATPase FlaH
MDSIILNQSQQNSIKKLDNFIDSIYGKFYILKGSAGTGKTTVITHFLNNPKFNSYKIAFSATTNKAVSVLKQMSPFKEDNSKYSFLTIHKLLNIRRKINKDGKEEFNMVEDNKKLVKSMSIFQYDIIIIDECSMLSNEIIHSLQKLKKLRGKIIFIGDPAQLPPVNEDSHIFNMKDIPSYELKEIMRYKGNIVNLANKVRDLVFNKDTKIKFKDYKCDTISVNKKYEKWFNSYLVNLKEVLSDSNLDNLPICLTYTNRQTEKINLGIRKELFGDNIMRFMENEIIIFNNYYLLNKNKSAYYTSQKSRVKKVELTVIKPKYLGLCDICNNNMEKETMLCGHKICSGCIKKKIECSICLQTQTSIEDFIGKGDIMNNTGYMNTKRSKIIDRFDSIFGCFKELEIKVWKLVLHNDDIIYVVHDTKEYNELIETLSTKIKKFRIFLNKIYGKCKCYEELMEVIWSYLYESVIDIFADISYGYCITTHKSQGSTFNNVYVDMNNIIFKNTNMEESYRCLYTAITRTSNKLGILI